MYLEEEGKSLKESISLPVPALEIHGLAAKMESLAVFLLSVACGIDFVQARKCQYVLDNWN